MRDPVESERRRSKCGRTSSPQFSLQPDSFQFFLQRAGSDVKSRRSSVDCKESGLSRRVDRRHTFSILDGTTRKGADDGGSIEAR